MRINFMIRFFFLLLLHLAIQSIQKCGRVSIASSNYDMYKMLTKENEPKNCARRLVTANFIFKYQALINIERVLVNVKQT